MEKDSKNVGNSCHVMENLENVIKGLKSVKIEIFRTLNLLNHTYNALKIIYLMAWKIGKRVTYFSASFSSLQQKQ